MHYSENPTLFLPHEIAPHPSERVNGNYALQLPDSDLPDFDGNKNQVGAAVGGAGVATGQIAHALGELDYRPVIISPGEPDRKAIGTILYVPLNVSQDLYGNHHGLFEAINRGDYQFMLRTILNQNTQAGLVETNYWLACRAMHQVLQSMNRPGKISYRGHTVPWFVMEKFFPGRPTSDLRRREELYSMRVADYVVVSTEAEKQLIIQLLQNPDPADLFKNNEEIAQIVQVLRTQNLQEKIVVVPLGVDQEKFNYEHRTHLRTQNRSLLYDYARAHKHIEMSDKTHVFGMLGRIEAIKNVDVAIQSFAEFMTTHHGADAVLVIVGGPGKGSQDPYWQKILEILKNLNDETRRRIIFTGPQNALAGLSVFDSSLNLSRIETFGLAALESMSTGLPNITNDTPINREIFPPGKGVYMCDANETTSVVKQMAAVYSLSHIDHQAQMHLAVNAASEFTWQRTAQTMEKQMLLPNA